MNDEINNGDNANKNNVLDFEDPGALPNELMDVPGFVNELKEYTLTTSPRPNEPIAFAGALAMLAHLSGRSYRDTRGTRTNLYLAALAPSGMGKERPRDVNKLLAAEAGCAAGVPDSVASGEGLEEAVAKHPSLLLQCDEADTMLTALRGNDGSASRLNEMLLRFFSESASNHVVRLKAADKGVAPVILNPHLTLFATGIPKFFYAALNARALENGLLGRCLFIEVDGFCPHGSMKAMDLPSSLVETASVFATREKAIDEAGCLDPVIVGDSPDGQRKVDELFDACDKVTRRLMEFDLGTAAALYARIPEKAIKCALLWAISEDPKSPRITADAVIWGTKFVSHITKRMLYMSQFYVAEGKFDRLRKRFLRILARHGGQLDHSTLLKRLAVDATLFRKIVETLLMSDLIEEEMLTNGKHGYILKGAA